MTDHEGKFNENPKRHSIISSQRLFIYNTLTKSKEEFQPISPPKVKMYVCGPTVYDFVHVGNFRGLIFFNLVRNWLTQLGYQVESALNYTDVDDKIINRARTDHIATHEVTDKYISEYEKDFKSLKLQNFDHNPRVTQYMSQIVSLIQQLLERECAYVQDGEVFFSIASFKDYGKLSHRKTEDLISGVRMEPDEKKRNPLDFSLWKPSKEGEPYWDSPWGIGRPGWHIECSAMIQSLFGDQIDIHGGGMDLIFPHHENEIAQSEGVSGKVFVKYWMHNNMLNMAGAKMSKSVGNLMTARKFLAQYHPEILKYMMLSIHYRSELDFSENTIEKSIRELSKIYSSLSMAKSWLNAETGALENTTEDPFIQGVEISFAEAMNQDFSTPEAFSRIFELLRWFNGIVKRRNSNQKRDEKLEVTARKYYGCVLKLGQVMSLFQEPVDDFLIFLDDCLLKKMNLNRADIDAIVRERSEAKRIKDYKKSDQLRDHLVQMRISISDTPEGTYWEVQK